MDGAVQRRASREWLVSLAKKKDIRERCLKGLEEYNSKMETKVTRNELRKAFNKSAVRACRRWLQAVEKKTVFATIQDLMHHEKSEKENGPTQERKGRAAKRRRSPREKENFKESYLECARELGKIAVGEYDIEAIGLEVFMNWRLGVALAQPAEAQDKTNTVGEEAQQASQVTQQACEETKQDQAGETDDVKSEQEEHKVTEGNNASSLTSIQEAIRDRAGMMSAAAPAGSEHPHRELRASH